jgi:hypothetical protein
MRLTLRASVLFASLMALTGITAPAFAAGPNFIIVNGPGLAKPVVLDEWDENVRLLSASETQGADVASESLASRPYLNLALLIGSDWTREKIDALGAEKIAEQSPDRFYPAIDGKEAVVAISLLDRRGPREAGPTVLAILARNGVPTRLEGSSGAGDIPLGLAVGVGAGLLLLGSLLWLWRRSRQPSALA